MIKNTLYFLAYWSGINALCGFFMRKKVFLLMYHSIGSKKTNKELRQDLYTHISIDSDSFEQQIAYLHKKGHTFISFDDIETLDFNTIQKPTIIYFDDGFKDNLVNAKPILEKYNVPATMFLVSGILDRTHMIWTILYKEALSLLGVSSENQIKKIENLKMGTEYNRVKELSQYPLSEYSYLFDIFLNWDDVKRMENSVFRFGSHGVSHTRLTELAPEDFRHETLYSKERIEEKVGQKVTAFSFPYGRGNNALVQSLNDAGYRFVVSQGKGINSVPSKNSKVHYFKNISPKPGESLMKFSLRLYLLNLRS